ncbi:hypothetical protein NE237_032798 [Protea cynaroides]|uniref:Integrase catalytic domain-containing protein n=1 Tax=Protea cynaroides TaxID=273540 RepID=A0A9Q0L4M9_9MAGN|nr:hypothetical protein NE237_032798 [Protea cynaroides]
MTILSKRGLLCGDHMTSLDFYEHCVFGKQTRVSFSIDSHTTKGTLDYIHSELWGPTQVPSKGSALYFLRFIDDYSGKVWAHFLKCKSNVIEIFNKWKVLVENQTNKKIKRLRIDNGLKFCNGEFNKFCTDLRIIRHRMVKHIPQQNGVAKHMNRTLMERTRLMVSTLDWKLTFGLKLLTQFTTWVLGDGSFVYLLLYVDDMLIAAKNMSHIQVLNRQLSDEFEIKDLGAAKKILGMETRRDRKARKLYLSQKSYIENVLEHFGMKKAKHCCYSLGINSLSNAIDVKSPQRCCEYISGNASAKLGTVANSTVQEVAKEIEAAIQISMRNALGTVKNKPNGSKVNSLYVLQGITMTSSANVSSSSDSNKDTTHLWHMPLDHMSKRGMTILSKRGLLCGDHTTSLDFYEHCVFGKQTRVSFSIDSHTTKGTLNYIHSELWGPAQVPSKGRALYFLRFIDDYSRKVWVHFLKCKSNVIEIFNKWKVLVENQTNKKIKRLRIDNGLKFCNGEFNKFCTDLRIIRHRMVKTHSSA